MTKSFNVKALGAFKKLGAVSLITATIFFTACNKTGGGKQKAPFVEGGASLILSPDNLTINVGAKTEDGSDIAVEGCEETTLKSDDYTELHATGTTVILKGNITELDCSFNQLTGLNVQGVTALKKLDCSVNQLPELNVQGLTALQKLKCSVNKLDKLNVQGLTSLQRLECGYNDITALDLQGLTSLEYLDCSPNQLRTLNASGLTALQQLWCSNNKLTTLDLQGCTALEKLSCWNNNLNALNVQGCTTLKSLICWCNKLNAQAMTKLLKALPARKASDDAEAQLYTEQNTSEGNWNDYTKPEDLKKAFEGAKGRNWKLKVQRKLGGWGDI